MCELNKTQKKRVTFRKPFIQLKFIIEKPNIDFCFSTQI